MKNISKETFINITICVLLSIAVLVCTKVLFDTLQKFDDYNFTTTASLISQRAVSSVPNFELKHPTEINKVLKGDVIAIGKARVKLNGTFISKTESQVQYKVNDTGDTASLYINHYTKNNEQLLAAIDKFFKGDCDTLMSLSGVSYQPENLLAYQQWTPDGTFPVIYDNASQSYYFFYAYGKGYYVLYSNQIFNMTTDMLTAHYPKPNEDPLLYHEYNTYEVQAINNTRNALSDGTLIAFEPSVPTAQQVNPDSANYNSKTADTTRADMIAKKGLSWSSDGTSPESESTVDITSASAKASMWVVGDETYLFTNQGLTVSDLTYRANSSHVEVSGKVTNTLPSERPYVLLVKFLDANNNLIGIDGTDSRNEPIAPNGSSVFMVDVPSTTLNPKDVAALMFEVY